MTIQPIDQTNIYHLLDTKKASEIKKLIMSFPKKIPMSRNFYKKLVYCKQYRKQQTTVMSKCFFRFTFLLAKKHWTHTHNFDSLVNLIAKCGGKKYKHTYLQHQKTLTTCPPFSSRNCYITLCK